MALRELAPLNQSTGPMAGSPNQFRTLINDDPYGDALKKRQLEMMNQPVIQQQQGPREDPYRKKKWNTLKSALSGGTFGGGGIPVGPIWTENQIQQRVNAARAGNDAAVSGEIARQGDSLAGRGFAAGSPLAQALAAQSRGANLASNTSAENTLRWDAAAGNARHVQQGAIANAADQTNRLRLNQDRKLSILGQMMQI